MKILTLYMSITGRSFSILIVPIHCKIEENPICVFRNVPLSQGDVYVALHGRRLDGQIPG